MKKQAYLNLNEAFPTIKFPPRVVAANIEEILRESYKKTTLKSIRKVKFDFSEVKWCDIFELSLISLWMLELRQKGKQVIFRFPAEKSVHQFLIIYRFDAFLSSYEIKKEDDFAFKAVAAPTDLPRAPFYPLTFFNEKGLRNLIDDLNYGNRLEVILNEVKEAEIVKSGVIRDVVLNELIDNVILHSNAQQTNLIMTKLGARTPDVAAAWTRNKLETVTDLEKPFFEKLYGQGYLALVLSDKGEGINNTLRSAYLADTIVKKPNEVPMDHDIVEYAFLHHSTRRPLEERIGTIKEAISEQAKKFPPATGLHRLKERVREYRGLLYVRSGSSIVCYDFYNDPLSDQPKTSAQIKGMKRLAELGGTQYKIYFPINLPKPYPPQYHPSLRQWKPAVNVQYQYLSLRQFAHWDSVQTYEHEANLLVDILNELDRIAFENKSKFSSMIVDFGAVKLSSKAIHYLLFELMQRQRPNLSIVAINVETERSLWQEIFEGNQYSDELIKPLLVFDENLNYQFYGATVLDEELFKKILDENLEQPEELRTVADKYEHLFAYDHINDRYHIIHSPNGLIRAAKEAIRNDLMTVLTSESAGIFHRNKRVFLPSTKYCADYFEVYKLTLDHKWRNLLHSWYKYWMIELKPDYIISVSKHMGELIREIITEVQTYDSSPIQHINLVTPLKDIELVRLPLKLDSDKKGIIATEVIGSAETLKLVLSNVQHTKVLRILTVINASNEFNESIEIKGKSYGLGWILRHHLTYHSDLPQGWRYSEVHRVEADTHLLIPNTVNFAGALWKGIFREGHVIDNEDIEIHSNSFLDECVIPTNSILEGHFTNNNKHITYLFNIPSIVQYFKNEITEQIVRNVQDSLVNINPPKKITHVLYRPSNPGLRLLANSISSKFTKCVPIAIDDGISKQFIFKDTSELGMDAVIVIDDAIVSGDGMFSYYEVAESEGATHIFSYVLIKRSHDYVAKRFEKISEYGHSKVQARYLADVELPTYSAETCPVCDRLLELEFLEQEFPDENQFSEFLQEEKNNLQALPISVIESEEDSWVGQSLIKKGNTVSIRWKLELAKQLMGPRKELNLLIANFENDPRSALSLLLVIFREKQVFLLDENLRQEIFYETFAKNIVKACRFFLGDINGLSDEELEAVLCILLVFDEYFTSDKILGLLCRTLHSERMFFRCLIQVFSIGAAYEYPGRIAKVFRELYETVKADIRYEEIIQNIWRYWIKKEEELKELRSKKLAWYNQLKSNTFHEIGHQKTRMLAALEDQSFNTEELLKTYKEFYENLFRAIPLLRNFSSNHVSPLLYEQLNSSIAAIELYMNEGKSLARSLKNLRNNSSQELSPIKELLRQNVLRTCTLISGEHGVNALLEKFMTNIKVIAYDVLEQQQEDLIRCGIEVTREFPTDACVVFGDDSSLFQIFQNLVENVWKNSDATRLHVRATIDDENELVDICFFDDGKGFESPLAYGGGLKVVNTNTRGNCGKFNIRVLMPDDDYFHKGFATLATVTLPYFKRK